MDDNDGLPAAAEMITTITDSLCEETDPDLEMIQYVTGLKVDLPVEIEFGNGASGQTIAMSAPVQLTETSVMPVLHRFRLNICLERVKA